MLQNKIRDYLIIIPARFNSSRFPGKPLAKIHGQSMLFRVWNKCMKVTNREDIVVATDDSRIVSHCKKLQMNYILTSKYCLTGTDRVLEVAKKIKSKLYINVQGDEPLVSPNDIKKIITEGRNQPNAIVNGMSKIKFESDFRSPNIPKVVIDNNNFLLFMSRSPIPVTKKNEFKKALKQVCIYSFPKKIISNFKFKNKKTNLEKIEDIEILRFLEKGYKIKMVHLSGSSIAVDTKKDLRRVISILKK